MLAANPNIPSNSEKVDHISLFQNARNDTEKWEYNLADVLSASNQVTMESWQHIFFSIFIWMTISYVTAYLVATLVAVAMLRKHRFSVFLVLPMLIMCVLGPATIGAGTSAILAFAISSAKKAVSPAYCVCLGLVQTGFVIIVSFTRILATL